MGKEKDSPRKVSTGQEIRLCSYRKGWKEEGTYYLWNLLWTQAVLGTLQIFSHLILTTNYYFHVPAEKLYDFLKVIALNERKEGGYIKSLTLKPMFFSLYHAKEKVFIPQLSLIQT